MTKEDVLIALKEIHARYSIPACEVNYTDKDYACMQYEKLVIHLSNKLDQLTNNWNELEECVESRLMSIPDDICTNEVEEARRTTKIAVYQVILGKMKEIKEKHSDKGGTN